PTCPTKSHLPTDARSVFHEISRAEGPSQQTTKGDRLSHMLLLQPLDCLGEFARGVNLNRLPAQPRYGALDGIPQCRLRAEEGDNLKVVELGPVSRRLLQTGLRHAIEIPRPGSQEQHHIA